MTPDESTVLSWLRDNPDPQGRAHTVRHLARQLGWYREGVRKVDGLDQERAHRALRGLKARGLVEERPAARSSRWGLG